MATTVQEVFDIVLAKINEIGPDGIETADWATQFPYLVNSRQRKLMQIGDLYSTFEFSNKPAENVLGLNFGFDPIAFEGTELIDLAQKPCQAYSVYVNYAGTFYIEDYNGAWNTLETVTWNTTSATPVRKYGTVTPSAGATRSRIRYNGTYRYIAENRALFNVPYQNDAQVPVYKRFVPVDMPADFKSADQVLREEAPEWYYKDAQYKWEGKSTLLYNYYLNGVLRMIYKPVPVKITALTDVLQIDDITATTVLPAYLAYDLYIHSEPDIALQFKREAEQLEAIASNKGPTTTSQMVDVYGGI